MDNYRLGCFFQISTIVHVSNRTRTYEYKYMISLWKGCDYVPKVKRTVPVKVNAHVDMQRSAIAGSDALPLLHPAEIVPDIPAPSRAISKPPHLSSSAHPKTPSLRILMVLDQLNIGGTETHTLALTRELMRQGVKIVIASKNGKMLETFIGLGCPIYEIDFVNQQFEPNTKQYPELLQQLSSIIESEQIDIIHAHQFPSGKIAKQAADKYGIPFVFTAHGTYYEAALFDDLRHSVVISVSPAIERMLQGHNIASQLIPNGVDITEFQDVNTAYRQHLRSKMAIPQDAQVILYAGRLAWEKADICKELIQATSSLRKRRYPRLHVIIVGGGREQDELMELANEKQMLTGQSFITFAGESVNMRSYYAVSDCVVGTGRIGLESMASMRPFIAIGSKGFLGAIQFANSSKAWDSWFGDHGSTPEMLTRDIIMDQIECILSMGPDDLDNLARWGRKHVSDRYPISTITKKMMGAYEQAIRSKSPLHHS